MIINESIFEKNLALRDGGALKWEEVSPKILDKNIYFNNSAIYGDDIASFPFRLELEYSPKNFLKCDRLSIVCYIQYPNIVSGSSNNFSINFAIKDIQNRTVRSINEGFIIFIILLRL